MAEVNPEHPVTQRLHDNWHKICLVLLEKLGGEIVITEEDIKAIFVEKYPDHAILAHEKKDGLHLKIITAKEARRLAVN